MEKNTAALLPCPFCAASDIFVEPDEVGSGGQWVAPVHVGCAGCKAEQTGEDANEAIYAWNRRASHPAPQAAAEGVVSIGDDVTFCDLITELVRCVEQSVSKCPQAFADLVAYLDSRAAPERTATQLAGDLTRYSEESDFEGGHYMAPSERGEYVLWSDVQARAALAAPAPTGESVSVKHAKEMQVARTAVSEMFQAIEAFMGIYDQGYAPESAQESKVRDAITAASNWLVCDVRACFEREKLMKSAAGGPRHD